MKFKLDENLGRSAAELLRLAGHEVATVAGEELCGTPDQKGKLCFGARLFFDNFLMI